MMEQTPQKNNMIIKQNKKEIWWEKKKIFEKLRHNHSELCGKNITACIFNEQQLSL